MKKLTILLALAGAAPLMSAGRANAHDVDRYDRLDHDRYDHDHDYAPAHIHDAYCGHDPRPHRDPYAGRWRAEVVPVAAQLADRAQRFARAMGQGHGWYSSHAPAIRVADAAARFQQVATARNTRPQHALAAWRQLEAAERQLAHTLRGERFPHSSYLRDNYFGFRAAFQDARLAVRDAVERDRYLVTAPPPVHRYEPAPYRPREPYLRVPPRRRGTVRRLR